MKCFKDEILRCYVFIKTKTILLVLAGTNTKLTTLKLSHQILDSLDFKVSQRFGLWFHLTNSLILFYSPDIYIYTVLAQG